MGARDLTDNIWLYGDSTESLRQTITNGSPRRDAGLAPIIGDTCSRLAAAYVVAEQRRFAGTATRARNERAPPRSTTRRARWRSGSGRSSGLSFSPGVATMVFFAYVDPLQLRDMTFPDLPISRMLGYTLGFSLHSGRHRRLQPVHLDPAAPRAAITGPPRTDRDTMANKKIDIAGWTPARRDVRQRIQGLPREVSGRFNTLRTAAVFWLLGMFYVFPWINRDGRQSVLFDLPARKFHIFGLTLAAGFHLPGDGADDRGVRAVLLHRPRRPPVVRLRLPADGLDRETFLWIERWTEGDRAKRMKLDQLPWTNPERLRRSGSKHVLWLVFALWTGFTFVGISFADPRPGGAGCRSSGRLETFWVVSVSLATWGNAGAARVGVQVHVPVRALPERDVRPQHAADRL